MIGMEEVSEQLHKEIDIKLQVLYQNDKKMTD